MNRLHVLVLLAAMACTGLVMGTVKAEAADSGKELRAAVNATAPPFAFMENGKLVGFEVDLHAEVAKRMGKQLVMTNIPFAGLAPGLQAKKWDAAGNTWINKERLVMMDFSDPWVDAQLAFVTRKNDAITSPEQLKGKTVGAEAGTAEQRWLDANQEKYGPYTIRTYDRSIDILMDLMNKRLDAYLREQTRALYQIKNYPYARRGLPRGRRVRSGRGLPQGRSPARRIQHDPQQHEAGRDARRPVRKVARHEARPRFFHCARVHDPLAAEITFLGRRSSAALPGGGRNAGREHTLAAEAATALVSA